MILDALYSWVNQIMALNNTIIHKTIADLYSVKYKESKALMIRMTIIKSLN